MRKIHPQEERFENFNELIIAASTKYTLSFREACKALKCSRSWANKYIKPNIPFIYLSNGKGTGKVNYARLVSSRVNELDGEMSYSNESLYLDQDAFESLIRNSIVSCQKRSKRLYRSLFIPKERLKDYYEEAMKLALNDEEWMSKKDLFEELDSLYLKYTKDPYVRSIIHPSIVKETKRTEATFIDVPVPNVPITSWKAVHDLMDYGDIEETIYRGLFRSGCIRLEIKLPDKNGEIKNSGKVYYVDDPGQITPNNSLSEEEKNDILSKYPKIKGENMLRILLMMDCINVDQSAWLEYNNKLGNTITY